MDELPVLVVHGGAVSWAVLAVPTLLSVAVWWHRRARRLAGPESVPRAKLVGARRPSGETLARLAVATVLFAAPWYVALAAAGHAIAEHYGELPVRVRIADIGGGADPLALACALPGARAAGLAAERELLGTNCERSERVVREEVAIRELQGECPVGYLLEHGRVEEALPAARRCGDAGEVIALEAWLGRFADADTDADADPALVAGEATAIRVLAGNWRAAATAADRYAASFGDERRPQVAAVRCVAQLLHVRAGDAPHFGDILDRETTPVCELAEQVSHPDAILITGADPLSLDFGEAFGVRADLRWAQIDAPERMATAASDVLWLAPFVPNVDRDRYAFGVAARRAQLAVYRGDLAAARALVATLHPYDAPTEAVRAGLAKLVGSRDGSVCNPPGSIPIEDIYMELDWPAALRAAGSGGGAPLALALRTTHRPSWLPDDLIALVPCVHHDREDLAATLRTIRPTIELSETPDIAFRQLDDLVALRDLARLAGDDTQAAAWQAILTRRLAPFADRDRMFALILWRAAHRS